MRHKHSNKSGLEIRVQPEELRMMQGPGGTSTVQGTAVVWNHPSNDLGFVERIAPSAFDASLKTNDVRLLREHKAELLLGRTSSGTLQLTPTSNGLDFHATLPNSPVGHDTAESIRRGDLKGMSFGFAVPKGGDEWCKDNGQLLRTVNKAHLGEISIVGNPAYNASSVSLRSVPTELRSLLTRSNDDGCDCDCDACMDGDCANCSMTDCDDPECAANGCPAQDDGGRSVHIEPRDIARYMRLRLAQANL